ncbi:Pseudooxynicotine oxidase [Nocardioides dokdonensis FR1436]|uniref:Pseudooxynicotine oxidase n=1 Tax=Nocardioides dokdonensis FR1436 TaxID=1300347 RepID=A0A1A9GQL7_9ACTN|nr:NAD(P)/FAD-dependent oxidoreductase [Nocardioides dokdonensis]ANH40376.1 Pseudooxynicotine oxidase [Nocardioides dokdonensis FR1436]
MSPDPGAGSTEVDVVVVGAGLAGLQCARELVGAGLDVLVLEGADGVGGRVRSAHVDGYTVDRGFQLLNPAYPAVRRWVDTAALGLQPLPAGVAARLDRGPVRLADPRREPALLGATLRGAVPLLGRAPAAARWGRPLLTRDHRGLVARAGRLRADRELRDALDQHRVRGDLRRVLDAFLSGVVLDDTGETSDHFALLLTRAFLDGTPALPRGGMQALPDQLARGLGARLHLRREASSLTLGADGATVGTDAGPVHARVVVVATSGPAAAALVDSPALPAPPTRGVVTHWWALGTGGLDPRGGVLHVDARTRPTGPLVNTAVVSAAAPSYAPEGRHLVQASALLSPGRRVPDEAAMRRHAAELLGTSSTGWDTVARHEVPDALPAQPAPLRHRQEQVLGPALVVCGDHRDTASLQGALVSGHRAAGSVLRLVRERVG